MTNKLGSSNPNRIPKKSDSKKAQKLFDNVLSDKYPIQSKGTELLDLVDKAKLNKKELKEL